MSFFPWKSKKNKQKNAAASDISKLHRFISAELFAANLKRSRLSSVANLCKFLALGLVVYLKQYSLAKVMALN
jgi:hypothetical protein